MFLTCLYVNISSPLVLHTILRSFRQRLIRHRLGRNASVPNALKSLFDLLSTLQWDHSAITRSILSSRLHSLRDEATIMAKSSRDAGDWIYFETSWGYDAPSPHTHLPLNQCWCARYVLCAADISTLIWGRGDIGIVPTLLALIVGWLIVFHMPSKFMYCK